MNPLLRPPPLPGIADRWALFFDVDGTLVEIEPHPDEVAIAPTALRLLAHAAMCMDGAVALLSGRSLSDLDRLTAPFAFPLAALHGCEWRDANGEYRRLRGSRATAEHVAAAGALGIRDMHGVWLEDKGIAFALHYRSARGFEHDVLRLANSIAGASNGLYVVQPGDCVAELKPAGASKGAGLRALMRTMPFAGRTPVVLGDDLTDESAFTAARELGGIAVIVGPRRPTDASHALSSPASVRAWLAEVVASSRNARSD